MNRHEQALEPAAGKDVEPSGHDPVLASESVLPAGPTEAAEREEPAGSRAVENVDPVVPSLLMQEGPTASPDPCLDGTLVGTDSIPEAVSDQYTRLAVALEEIRRVQPLKLVTISSASRGEGRTLTAVNLALTLAQRASGRVLLIDTDLLAPSIHTVFQLSNATGLSELIGSTAGSASVVEVSPHLVVLTAGHPSGDSMALLVSPRMRELLKEAAARFEWVVLDAPSVECLDDPSLLAWLTDGTVLVVDARHTAEVVVEQAILALGRDRVLGIVLNGSNAAAQKEHRRRSVL